MRVDLTLCKVAGCPRPAKKGQRRMCDEHFATRLDGRPRCSFEDCNAPACQPYTDKFCKSHHPRFKVLTPLQSQVVEQMAKGASPTVAVEMVTGLPKKDAVKTLQRWERDAAMVFAMRGVMDQAGTTVEHLARTIHENTQAEKVVLSRDGEPVSLGRDYRASTQAVDIALKLGGYYPKKNEEQKTAEQTFNIQVVSVPPAKQIDSETPIYTIKKDE